jgi:8-oxo-dGTP pyrophosphatase MutT (NUDIX family)
VDDPIRLAASVIGVRDGPDGPEVLVIRRTMDHRFLPGYVAFPGGAVDPGDRALAERWFGDAEQAARAAAVRELAEEVGLALTAAVAAAADPDRPLAAIDEAPPPADSLHEIGRWIAPQRVPVRFDARFYAVRMDDAAAPRPDGEEAAEAWWSTPRAVLDRWEAGEVLLFWPTHFTMLAFADGRDAGEILGMRLEPREPGEDDLARLPRSVFFQGEAG